MKIVQLTAENFKRLKAVSIRPDGAVVEITGRNSQGKSSVLDSISAALGGADSSPEKPVREGQRKSKVVCDLGDIVVTRTFTAGGGDRLEVNDADGKPKTSPQSLLDKLCGKLTFDPLAFTRMDSKGQAATLKALLGLDFSGVDLERRQTYEDRTIANRHTTQAEAAANAMPHHLGAPTVEISVTELAAQLQSAHDANKLVDDTIAAREKAEVFLDDAQREISRLEELLNIARSTAAECAVNLEAAELAVRNSKPVDPAPIMVKIKTAEADNAKVRANRARAEKEKDARKHRAHADELTQKLELIDADKKKRLESAQFPVAGLSFDDGGCAYNGIPFTQASAAEQLKVSVAIAVAMHPQVRIMLIRDGSLLDKSSMVALAEMAEVNGLQVWVERVSDGEGTGIVIEDGEIKEGTGDDEVIQ